MIGQDEPNLVDFPARLKGLLAKYPSYAAAASDLDIPATTLARLARGANDPGSDTLLKLATRLNVSMSYLAGTSDDPTPTPTRLAKPGHREKTAQLDVARVPKLEVRAAAGAGSVNQIHAVNATLPFPLWMLHKLAAPGAKVSFMRASGDSMWPTFDDKALLLVNESETELPRMAPKASGDLDIFVFLQEDHLRVKRLSRVGKEIVATSDNRKYSPEILRGPDLKRLKIIGRVIWWDNRL